MPSPVLNVLTAPVGLFCSQQTESARCQRSGGTPSAPTWSFIYSTHSDWSCASTNIELYDMTGICNPLGLTVSSMWTCESAADTNASSSRPSVRHFDTADCSGHSYVGDWPLGQPTAHDDGGYSFCSTAVRALLFKSAFTSVGYFSAIV